MFLQTLAEQVPGLKFKAEGAETVGNKHHIELVAQIQHRVFLRLQLFVAPHRTSTTLSCEIITSSVNVSDNRNVIAHRGRDSASHTEVGQACEWFVRVANESYMRVLQDFGASADEAAAILARHISRSIYVPPGQSNGCNPFLHSDPGKIAKIAAELTPPSG